MTPEPFSCVVVGEEALLVECTRLLLARGHEVTAVVSPAPDLIAWAEGEGLATVPLGPDLAERLAPLRFDYLFSIANLRMLPDDVLALPARLPVNFHDGPLPRHAGLFATSWAILDGDKQHGVTWHVMTAEADTGDVLKQRPVPVDPAATVHDLDIACFDAGIESFGELVDELAAGTATRTPQDLGLRTYHGKYDGPPRAGLYDWRQPAADLDALVRATSFGRRPNGFGIPLVALGDTLIAVRAVEILDRPSPAEPGTLVDAAAEALTVATGDRDVRLTHLADLTGERLDPLDVAGTLTERHSGRFPHLTDAEVAELTRAGRAAHRQETRWLRTLGTLEPVLAPRFGALGSVTRPADPVALPAALRGGATEPVWPALAAVLAFLARLARDGERDVALPAPSAGAGRLLAAEVPLRLPEGLLDRTLPGLTELVAAEVTALRGRSPYRRDLLLRHPSMTGAARAGLPVAVRLPGDDEGPADRPLTIRIDAHGTVRFHGGEELTADQVRWLGEHLALFLDTVAAEPGRPLGQVPLLTPGERELVQNRWNDTAEDYPAERTVSRLVSDLACAAPDRPAVRFEGRELTYGELDQAADRLARHLLEQGAGRGSLVGVLLERSPDLLVALLAVMKTGAAYVPIDPIYPPARIGHMIEDSGARLVVTDEALGRTLTAFPVTPVTVAPHTAPGSPEPAAAPVDRSEPDAAAYVIYTSGSTGLPKGVQVGHRALVNFLWTMARRPGFDSRDSLSALTTVCFDIAGLELFLPLVRGGTVEVLPAPVAADGVALRERIERTRPTVLQATPTTWQMLIAAGWTGDPGLRALCGGEPLPAELADRLTGLVGELYNMYGPTETTIWSTVDRVRPGEPVTIGRPIGNTRCHVLDERGMPVPPGIPGELYLSGDGVADGYLGRPELTAERFVTAPWGTGRAYRTGDLVRYLPDGRLEYLERIDGQIKLNGYRIELGEVESALRRIPEVTSAVALVREDRPGERRLVAYVTGSAGLPQPADLRAALRDGLPAYMVPASVVVLPELPLTPNGKIDRKALPVPRPARTAGAGADVRTDLERRIAEVWCQVLRVDRVGAEDNFFDLGGDSLRLTSVTAMLRERLGRPVTRLDMFGHPTVRAMAAHLSDDTAPAAGQQRRGRDVAALAQRRSRRKGRG
ncbi:amino acid adenylation domain-containing protein [Streptomyces sp. S.PNR 29]|uniref:amino acid adenylation domain-containing protein n=1 Tax=Streptomyces sp. S.PNR 29 TaxID=2973805 RepID=UPI0025AFA895|nr:amino acid adenylation domain-containing protein [Streptomyces sp. S.PNR 29]MDN0200046.1 amino acid adenylation domain-containing protein [Streptomyces sp. S.PNR 29]